MKNIRGTAHGLAPMFLDPNSGSSGSFGSNHVTLGARGDSYYEYDPGPATCSYTMCHPFEGCGGNDYQLQMI